MVGVVILIVLVGRLNVFFWFGFSYFLCFVCVCVVSVRSCFGGFCIFCKKSKLRYYLMTIVSTLVG